MFTLYRVVLAAFSALSATAAFAQMPPDVPNPSDASAAVPAVEYVSTLTHYRAAPEQDKSADKAWQGANAEVGKLGGHAGHLRSDGAAADQHRDGGH